MSERDLSPINIIAKVSQVDLSEQKGRNNPKKRKTIWNITDEVCITEESVKMTNTRKYSRLKTLKMWQNLGVIHVVTNIMMFRKTSGQRETEESS